MEVEQLPGDRRARSGATVPRRLGSARVVRGDARSRAGGVRPLRRASRVVLEAYLRVVRSSHVLVPGTKTWLEQRGGWLGAARSSGGGRGTHEGGAGSAYARTGACQRDRAPHLGDRRGRGARRRRGRR